jgi:hypothetical protein
MSHKLGVCVPYRNRELHLNEFIPKVGKYLKNQGIDFQMYFAHQIDDKLFNRGATKNIAAKHAFEDGCDYIVWHDIDMIPEEGGGADYSYPEKHPRHIATKISQMDYQLKYHEYFGGAVLFTKEQVEATNGYSNNYWDWGMEDDDLFWRCHLEGMTNSTYLDKFKSKFLSFDGNHSYAKIPFDLSRRSLTSRSHTLSILVRPYQIPEKNKIFLIGDDNHKYVEYPVLRLPGYDYGISFNNSRALSLTFWNSFNKHNYMWIKRYDRQWSWVTVVIDEETHMAHLYLNGTEIDSKAGQGSPSPLRFNGRLKNYGSNDMYLGSTPSESEDSSMKFFKGDIAKVYAWKRALTPIEVAELHTNTPQDELAIDLDFNNPKTVFNNFGAELKEEEISVPNSIIPHRVEGKMRCLPHEDEGLVNGKWAKGATTAENEKRYVLQMQQGKTNHKEDGIKQLEYKLESIDVLTPFAKMLNITL